MTLTEATDRSTELRQARAALKRRVHDLPPTDARLLTAEAIEDPDPDLRGLPLLDLLLACRGLGPQTVRCLLRRAQAPAWRYTLGDLRVRDRLVLAALLRAGPKRARAGFPEPLEDVA